MRFSLLGYCDSPRLVPPLTAVRKNGSENALRTVTSPEEAFAARAKLVVDAGMGMLSSYRPLGACSPARRKDSRWRGTMYHADWVGGIHDEVLSSSILRRPGSAPPATAIRKYGAANALRATTSFEKAFADRAKLDVNARMGMLSSRRLSEGMLPRPETRFAAVRYHASRFLSSPVCFPAFGGR